MSKHAAERAVERGISIEGIKDIVFGNVFNVVAVNKHDPRVSVITGMYAGKLWSVIYDTYTCSVITVRRAHKKEEVTYYA